MFSTFNVSNFEISKEFNIDKPENIYDISFTFFVSKSNNKVLILFEFSKRWDISTTFDVTKFLISKDVKELH